MKKPEVQCALIEEKKQFQMELLRWFGANGRDFPWRASQDPYAILVSEIMLQQTTVATVLPRFSAWLARFPTIESLASAAESEVLRAWEGLGYYQRARNLQKACQEIVARHNSKIPADFEQIKALPGIGRYTAGAVAAFAFNLPAAILEANTARVLARLVDLREAVDSTLGAEILWNISAQLLDRKSPKDFNSALMELGQTLCSPKNPACGSCPVALFCQTHEPELLPIKKPKPQIERVVEHAIFWRKKSGLDHEILLARQDGRRRQGLWRFPQRSVQQTAKLPILLTANFTITHHKVTLYLHQASAKKPGMACELLAGEKWVSEADLDKHPMPSPERRVLLALMKERAFELV